MADSSDVGNKLVSIIAGIVYPNGTSSPSIVTAAVKVFRGWPVAANLDADMLAGKINISVFAPPNMERNTTRYLLEEQIPAPPVHTLTALAAGNQITIGGTISTPQNALALLASKYVYAYPLQPNDTLATAATGLAALIAVDFPGTDASGPVITIAGEPGVVRAGVSGKATVSIEQGRQEKTFRITCWCPTPALRDLLAPIVDLALRQLPFITLADQTAARLRYESGFDNDEGEKVQIYRRDLNYCVEYATTSTSQASEVGAIGVGVSGNGAPPDTRFT